MNTIERPQDYMDSRNALTNAERRRLILGTFLPSGSLFTTVERRAVQMLADAEAKLDAMLEAAR